MYDKKVKESLNLSKYADIWFACPHCDRPHKFGEFDMRIYHIGADIFCPSCHLNVHFDFRDKTLRKSYFTHY